MTVQVNMIKNGGMQLRWSATFLVRWLQGGGGRHGYC